MLVQYSIEDVLTAVVRRNHLRHFNKQKITTCKTKTNAMERSRTARLHGGDFLPTLTTRFTFRTTDRERANLLPALGGQGRRRRRRLLLRNRRGVASPREEEEEEEDGAGDDWPGRRSAVYCAGALPGTYCT